MAKKTKNRSQNKKVTSDVSLFGPAPLLKDENANDYSALMEHVRDAVKPADYIEEMWVEDCTYLFWDTLRLRRQRAELINANLHRGLQVILETLCPQDEAIELTSRWSVGDEGALRTIGELLEAAHLSMDAVKAQTMAETIEVVERMDRMIGTSETRRNATLREIEYRRTAFARILRQATNVVEDAEFDEVKPPQIGGQNGGT